MIKVIEDESAIKKYQRKFIRSFKPFVDEKIAVRIGHMGASFDAKVLWSHRLGFWIYSTKGKDGRYWNAFGLDRPKPQSALSITCEINLPVAGIDRRMGGALARDKKNNVYLIHRGIIGGGKKGIGKSLFASQFRGVWTSMDDGDHEVPVAVVGVMNSPFFVRQVLHFIRKIDSIKNKATPALQLEIFDSYALREELIGAKLAESVRDLNAECNTALIIKDLYEKLESLKLKAGNDASRDLFTVDANGAIRTIFHVRTDALPDTLHRGAMRLITSSLSMPQQPRLILVLPAEADIIWKEKLRKLNIETLTYTWSGDHVEFEGIEGLMSAAAP